MLVRSDLENSVRFTGEMEFILFLLLWVIVKIVCHNSEGWKKREREEKIN